MKRFLFNIVEAWLSSLAKKKISKGNPKIIAITGSYGKTSTKEAIYFILSKKFGLDCGKNWGNMNSTIGLPLSILGLKNYSFGIFFVFDLIRAFWGYFFYELPKILVLELGIDKPGEMNKLVDIVKPDIGVLTGISETHLEELKNIDGVRKEKALMISAIKTGGCFVVNGDDDNCQKVVAPEGVKTVKYGKNFDVTYSRLITTPVGNSFDIVVKDKSVALKSKLVGRHSVNILLAATAVSLQVGLDLSEIAKRLEQINPQKGRMNPIKLKNQMVLIDDTYNSNPKSAIEALNTLQEISWKGRKVAILGNMNELGDFTRDGHHKVGKKAGEFVDILIVVGPNSANFINGAVDSGMNKNSIFSYINREKLILDINNRIKAGDLILLKASQNKMRFEKIAEYLIDDKSVSKNILVRQEKKWKNLL